MAAVDGLSFTVGHGEILGVGGPNGAGKTTLFDVISGLTRASGGTITFDGHDITGKSADRVCHAGISRTFQLNAAYDTLTVAENVLCASYYGFRNVVFPKFRFDRATRARAEEAIAFVGLEDDTKTVVRRAAHIATQAAHARCRRRAPPQAAACWTSPLAASTGKKSITDDGPPSPVPRRTGADHRPH